ncbi:hypothetical protein AVEN_14096-1 [Araneus ventricosus]|uniref:Uncharacterized protein n=1 Tax=Araneus ventricosus TaxID=182803 RepID=A0A4Y2FX52_ARAVE|nr:hypothetical protein AVEN_14096-1 [Araneus ventricosus]
MMASRLMFATIIICLVFNLATSDDDKEVEEENKASFGDAVGESVKGMNNWFKGMADEAKEKAADSMDIFKSFSAVAMDASEGGVEKAKGWAEGLGDSFGKAKEKFSETGEKMKEVVGDAMLNTKEEIETAASKMTNYAKDATGSMLKLLG